MFYKLYRMLRLRGSSDPNDVISALFASDVYLSRFLFLPQRLLPGGPPLFFFAVIFILVPSEIVLR